MPGNHDIINASDQFDCENPYLQLINSRLHSRMLTYRMSVVVCWVINFTILVGSPLYININYDLVIIIFIIFPFVICAIDFFYIMPHRFHEDLKSGLLTQLFHSSMETRTITSGLVGWIRTQNLWRISASTVIFFFAGLVNFNYHFIVIEFWILLGLSWQVMLSTGMLVTYLPRWVYVSGIGILFVVLTFLVTATAGIGSVGLLTGDPRWFRHEYSEDMFMACAVSIVVMFLISRLVWHFVPKVADMRRRGCFD